MVPGPKKEPLRVVLVGFHPLYEASLTTAFRDAYGLAGVELFKYSHHATAVSVMNLHKPDVIIVWPEQIGACGTDVMRRLLAEVNHKDRTTFIGTYDDQIAGCEKHHWGAYRSDPAVHVERASTGEDYLTIVRSVASGTIAQMT